jgi:hypothetical protein
METRTKILGLRAVIITLLLLMPFGSPGDTVALIFFSLLLTSRKIIPAIRSSPLLTCLAYSSLATAATWANSRYRLDAAPFHLVTDHTWRGYPLPNEEWVILVPGSSVWSKFHWAGAAIDALIIGVGWFAVGQLIGTSNAGIGRILVLSIYCGVFVWLNIEVWLYGAPALFFCNSCLVVRLPEVTLGFPFVYLSLGKGQRMSALVADIVVGIAGWLVLYGLMRWARWLSQSSSVCLVVSSR